MRWFDMRVGGLLVLAACAACARTAPPPPVIAVSCAAIAPPRVAPPPRARPMIAADESTQPIALVDAVTAARVFLDARAIDLSRGFLQGAVYEVATQRWVIDWQLPAGLLVVVDVSADGVASLAH